MVTFVGSLTPEKQIGLAIRTVAVLESRAVLVVAGDGPALARARADAGDALPDGSVFLGEVPDVRPLLHASDVLLITSAVEGMPGAAIEAALCGVPVVSTDVGAVATMPFVRVAPATPIDLAAAVSSAIADGPVDPAAARAFTWPAVLDDWRYLLNSVTGRCRSSS